MNVGVFLKNVKGEIELKQLFQIQFRSHFLFYDKEKTGNFSLFFRY